MREYLHSKNSWQIFRDVIREEKTRFDDDMKRLMQGRPTERFPRYFKFLRTVLFYTAVTLALMNPMHYWRAWRTARLTRLGYGYWKMYRYHEDRAMGEVNLGMLTRAKALKIVAAMPNTKITYIDDENGFIFVN